MNIGFIVDKHFLNREITAEVLQMLWRRDLVVDVICPQDSHLDPESGVLCTADGRSFDLNRYDALLARCDTLLGLAILAYADTAGILTINSPDSIRCAHNREEVALALNSAGIRCLPAVVADAPHILATLSEEWFPRILKATRIDDGQGAHLIDSSSDLKDVRWSGELVLAQHCLPGDACRVTLYACGETVFAVRRPSLCGEDPGAPSELFLPDSRMVGLAWHCGDVLGLDIYAVDVVETPDGLTVVEVTVFPDFTSVPWAADAIAAHVQARVQETAKSVWPTPEPSGNVTNIGDYLRARASRTRSETTADLLTAAKG